MILVPNEMNREVFSLMFGVMFQTEAQKKDLNDQAMDTDSDEEEAEKQVTTLEDLRNAQYWLLIEYLVSQS